MTDRQLYILDQFSAGQLTSSEQKEFDTYLEELEFKEAVQTTKDLNVVIQHERSEAFREKMQSWDTNESGVPTKRNFLKWIWIGLVLLGIGAIYMTFFKPAPQPQPELLFAEYAVPYKNIYLPVSRSEHDESIEMEVMSEYETGNYQEVVKKLQNINNTDRPNGLKFYGAVSHFMLGDFSRAEREFILLNEADKYHVPCLWYRFLIAVKRQDTGKLEIIGKALTEQTTHPVLKRKAEELLGRLQHN